MPRVRLTRRQADALQAITAHWDTEGCGPTLQELGDALGIVDVSALGLVRGLLAAGVLEDLGPPGASRRWAPVDDEPAKEAPG